jgi:putative nucleotidyltransferase with HDIG domain
MTDTPDHAHLIGVIILAKFLKLPLTGYEAVMEKEEDFFRGTGLEQLVHEGAARDVELILRAKSGERIPVIFNGSVIYEEDGRLSAVVGVARDIRERKRAEEELRQSHAQLQRTLEGTINVLVSAIEMRDPYTAGHQRRVTQLACAIAEEMGLPKERIEGLRMAGLIHDLGKINVPAEILSKPGPLNDLEYGIVKVHAQVGYDVLKGIEFPWPVAEIVLQHHERLNGSGYPQGLSDDDIILEARILGVADVVEAMSSHRPYRPPRGLDKALEEISQNRGVLYDPEVVDACLRLFTEKGFTFWGGAQDEGRG